MIAMNTWFKRDNHATQPVDLDQGMKELTLADRLPAAPQLPVSNFAPRRPVEHVDNFLALPLKEIDDAMAALKAKYETACAHGQQLRDLFMEAREAHLANLKREKAFAEFTTEAFDALERKYSGLDQPKQEQAAEAPQQTEEVQS